jgi:hypothetical protein
LGSWGSLCRCAYSVLAVACSVQINLSDNTLCGIKYGRGTYTADGIKAIAESISVSPSVTSVTLLGNNFDDATVEMLLKLKREKPSLISLCGLALDQTEANFKRLNLRPADARLLAPEIIVRPSLTEVLAFRESG